VFWQFHRVLLGGGGWNDPTYSFNDSYTQSALDRSIANGFRCIKTIPGDTTLARLTVKVSSLFRDYKTEKPVDDKTFSPYLNQYSYPTAIACIRQLLAGWSNKNDLNGGGSGEDFAIFGGTG